MLRYNFYDLSNIPAKYLSHTELADAVTDASERANQPHATLADCPWNRACCTRSRYKRVVWRTVFRCIRDHRLRLIARANEAANRKAAA